MSDQERTVAQQSQEKFHFYLVALVFTILGLSIQTASFDGPLFSRVFEILAWLFLGVSGLSGLSYLEFNPLTRIKMTMKDEMQEKADNLRRHKQSGMGQVHVLETDKVVPTDERIDEYDSYIKKLDEIIGKLEKDLDKKYLVFKWTFVAGVSSILIGRSYAPILGIVNEIFSKA